MRDHGASAIVPLNRCMIVGCAAFSLFMLPWWATTLVTVVLAMLWKVASDQYGGMQVCLLLLPGMFLGLAAMGKRIQEAEASGRSIGIGAVVVNALGPPALFVLSMLGAMTLIVGTALARDWLIARFRRHQGQSIPSSNSDDESDGVNC